MPTRRPAAQASLFAESSPQPSACQPVGAAALDDELTALAGRMPAGLWLGGSTWSFPGWAGLVYDRTYSEGQLARHGLAAYARHPLLKAVGVDRTYYAPVPARELAAYADVVPADFRFFVKAHEALTLPRFPDQPRYGALRGQANRRFLDPPYASEEVIGPILEGLGTRTGGILFQFSPTTATGPLATSPEAFAEALGHFLAALPRGPFYAIELRSAELLVPAYAAALRAAGACHCLSVYGGMPDLRRQVVAVDAGSAPALFVRWVVRPSWSYATARERCLPFARLVEEDPVNRRAIAQLCVKASRRGLPALVAVHNLAEGSAPLSIALLAREIAAQLAAGENQPSSTSSS